MISYKSKKPSEWCIIKYYGSQGVDVLIRLDYQWEAVHRHLQRRSEVVARGFKSHDEALKWATLFKEEG